MPYIPFYGVAAAAPPPPSGPASSLLMHFDGLNDSTTFIDSSSYAHTVTRIGNPLIKSAQSKFGGTSGKFVNNSALTVPHHTSLDLTTGDFTIELFIYRVPTGSNEILVAKGLSSAVNYPWQVWYEDGTQSMRFRGFDNAVTPSLVYNLATGVTATGTWYHLACVRDGSTFRLFLDGVQKDSATFAGTLFNSVSVLSVGAYGNAVASTNGYIDELRIVKGTAVYTGAFTPPAAPFTS